jgi:hypothetical protein
MGGEKSVIKIIFKSLTKIVAIAFSTITAIMLFQEGFGKQSIVIILYSFAGLWLAVVAYWLVRKI